MFRRKRIFRSTGMFEQERHTFRNVAAATAVVATAFVVAAFSASGTDVRITAEQAGQGAVQDTVSRVHVAKAPGVTFVAFRDRHPRSEFTAVTWPENLAEFPSVGALYDRTATATQTPTAYRGSPEIVLRDPIQLH